MQPLAKHIGKEESVFGCARLMVPLHAWAVAGERLLKKALSKNEADRVNQETILAQPIQKALVLLDVRPWYRHELPASR